TTIMPFEPRPRAKAWLWRYGDLARLAELAGKLVPIDRGGDRRVLAAINPGLVEAYGDSVYGATATLWGAVQYLGPHESPPGARPGARSAVLRYPWAETEAALEGRRGQPDPYDDVHIRYTNPATGGPVLPTLDATIQLLRAGVRTRPHRHVHSTVYQAFRGRGETIVDGVRFAWERGDMFALPPWVVHEHHAPDGDALLFSITDAPVLSALGLERALGLDTPQEITGEFQGP